MPCWHSDKDEKRFDEEGTGSSLVCVCGDGGGVFNKDCGVAKLRHVDQH